MAKCHLPGLKGPRCRLKKLCGASDNLGQPSLERSLRSLKFITVLVFEEKLFGCRSPLITLESTNSFMGRG